MSRENILELSDKAIFKPSGELWGAGVNAGFCYSLWINKAVRTMCLSATAFS